MQNTVSTQIAPRGSFHRAPRPSAPRRPLSLKQRQLLPLAPLFEACRAKGLAITEANRRTRIRAINVYLYENEMPFNWLILSFKELLTDRCAILVLADAIEAGVLTW